MDNNADNFTTGSIPKKLLKFMIPIFGALTLQAMYGAVDMLVVGKFGTTEGLSAVSTGSAIITFFIMVIAGLTMGITVLIGRYIGEGKQERIRWVVGGAVCFFGCLGVVLTVLIVVLASPLASVMQAPRESFRLTVQFIRISGAGTLFIVGYNVISGIFRGAGNSRLPLIFVAIASVINVALDLLFVGVFHMNAGGAALANIISQALSVVVSLSVIKSQPTLFSVKRKDIKFNAEIGKFCKLGLPLTLQSAFSNMSFLLICAFINNLGLTASSGYGVAQKIISFIMLVPGTLIQAIAVFVSQNTGANQPQRAKSATWFGIAVGASIGVLCFIMAFFKGAALASLFSGDGAVIVKAAEYLKGFSPDTILTCISFSLVGYFNGRGRTIFTLIQGLAQSLIVRVPVTYAMCLLPDVTLTQIGIAVPSSSAFGIVLCIGYYIYLEKKENDNKNISEDCYMSQSDMDINR